MRPNPFQKPSVDPCRLVAGAELVERARSAGFGRLIVAMSDPEMFTRDGRLIEARLARAMGVDKRRVPSLLAAARRAIGGEHVL